MHRLIEGCQAVVLMLTETRMRSVVLMILRLSRTVKSKRIDKPKCLVVQFSCLIDRQESLCFG